MEDDLGQLECVCRREGKCHVPGAWNTGSQANGKNNNLWTRSGLKCGLACLEYGDDVIR